MFGNSLKGLRRLGRKCSQLRLITMEGYKAKQAKRKVYGAKSGGHQVQAKSSLPVRPAMNCGNTFGKLFTRESH